MRFGGIKLIPTNHASHALGTWYPQEDEVAAFHETKVIEPGKQERFEAVVARYGRDVEIFEPKMFLGIRAGVLDPYRGRTIVVRGIPEWKKSKRARLWRIGLPV